MGKKPRKGQLLADQYPTHYLPNVGRQVMQDGGVPEDTQRAHDFIREQLYGDAYRPSPVVEKYAEPTAAQALEINRDRPASTASEFVRHQLSKDEPQLPQYDRENVQAWKEGAKELGHLAAYGIPYVGEGLMAYDLANAAKSLARPGASSQDRAIDLVNAGLALPGMGRAAKAAAVAGAALAPEEAQAGVVDRALKAIRAYHGSPHKFDKFDISKIGTGEGAQAYGHGLYFAENPEVAHAYREALSPYGRGDRPEDIAARVLHATRGDRDAALAELRNRADTSLQAGGSYEGAQRLMEARNIVNTNPEVAGHMYEVDIHANPEHLLDWDKPIANQPHVVRGLNQYVDEMGGEQALKHFSKELEAKRRAEEEQIARLWESDEPLDGSYLSPFYNAKYTSKEALTDLLRNIRNDEEPIGAEFYRSLAPQEYDYKGATETARRLGIPGLKYFDRLSRGAGTGSRNYVMFDPNLVDITRRYAKGGDVEGYDKGGAIAKVLGKLMAPGSGYAPRKGFPELVNLPGIGKVESRPIPEIESIARRFAGEAHGADVTPLNPEFSKRVAQEYDVMRHDPQDPIVKRAFQALADETMQQYRAAKDLGLDIKFLKPGQADPYAASPALGYEDIVNRGRLFVYPTEAGFGSTGGINASNVLLKGAGRIGDKEDAVVNDAFRVIHDLYGHFGPGNPFFRAPGEERAFQLHKRMFSPEARPALTSETRGQNSWVNFGDMAERNRAASGADTYYADQKTGIMPKWTMEEPPAEGVDVEEYIRKHRADGGEVVKRALQLVQNPNFKKWFEGSKAITPAGDPLRLYHGTTVWDRGDRSLGDFNEFDRMASVTQVRRPQWVDTIGSWFSDNPGERGAGLYSGDEGAIYPVYLNIKKPMSATFDDLLNKAKEIGPQVVDKFQSTPRKTYYKTAPEAYEKLHHWIKDQGYDSVIIPKGSTQEFEHQNVYIATDPRQIKSATGNIGTFDPLNPDIRKSEGGDVEGYDKGGAIAKALQAASRIIAPSEKMGVIHGVSAHVLPRLKELGAIPSPSLAITKPLLDNSNFGNITFVGRKHLAEPSDVNPIFGQDAFTARFPYIEGRNDKTFYSDAHNDVVPLNIENVLEHMRSRPVIGGENWTRGQDRTKELGVIMAEQAPAFKSLEDIKSARDKIVPMHEWREKAEALEDQHTGLAKLLHRYADPRTAYDASNAEGYFGDALSSKNMDEWRHFYPEAPQETIDAALKHLENIRKMPAMYFEGKPQRAVNFDEFAGAVVPEATYKDVSPILRDMGIKDISTYAAPFERRGERVTKDFGEHMFADGGPVKNIPRADDEQFFRRLALWTYSVAPLFSNTHQLSQNRLGYDKGGVIAKALKAAANIAKEETAAPAIIRPVDELFPGASKRYAVPGEPSPAIDKDTGKPYLKKELSPEGALVLKARQAAQKAINKGDFKPYFDPSERFDVNVGDYAPYQSTLDIRRVQPATQEKYEALARAPEATERLQAAYKQGLGQAANAGNWYYMGQLQDAFIKQYGPELGRDLFKERFADAMAATTGGADPTTNLMMAHYGNYLKTRGEKLPEETYNFPYPIGGRFAGSNMDQYRQMILEGQGIGHDNPKRYNFSYNFLGEPRGITLDEQMSNIIDPKMNMPPTGTYGHYEGAVNDLARAHGVDPRYFQEVAWAGGKDLKAIEKNKPRYRAQPMIQNVNEAIERTSRITGLSPRSVVERGLVGGEIPLYQDGGAVIDRALDVVSNLPHARKQRDAA